MVNVQKLVIINKYHSGARYNIDNITSMDKKVIS